MRIRGRVLAVCAAALVTLGLCHCGGSLAQPDAIANKLEVQQPFEGHEAEQRQKLQVYVDRALEKGRDCKASVGDDTEEAELTKTVNANFKKANKAYRKGEYAKAQELYEKIIKDYPTHYGANVNLTLALLQQNDASEALGQALTCVYLFPMDGAVLLNVQTAGAAMGFAPDHVESAMNDVAKVAPQNAYSRRAEVKGEYEPLYRYNKLWDSIETELHEIAARRNVSADVVGESDSADAEEESADAAAVEAEESGAADAEGASAAEEDADAELTALAGIAADFQTYNDLVAQVEQLEQELPDDADVAALGAYLHAIGLQLGFEADASLVEPVQSMPFVVVDNDLCLIRVTGLTKDKKGEERELGVEITNKAAASLHFALDHDWNWSINGSGSIGHLEPTAIEPGETQSLTLQTGYHGDGELTSYAGVIEVKLVELDSVIARYPMSWAAPAAE